MILDEKTIPFYPVIGSLFVLTDFTIKCTLYSLGLKYNGDRDDL